MKCVDKKIDKRVHRIKREYIMDKRKNTKVTSAFLNGVCTLTYEIEDLGIMTAINLPYA